METGLPQASAPSQHPVRKILLIASIGAFVIGLLILILYFFAAPKTPSVSPPVTAPQFQTLTGLSIAKQTALFLDKALLPDGKFPISYTCIKTSSPDDSCLIKEDLVATQQAGWYLTGYITQAYWDLYKRTNENAYKEQADKTINAILTGCNQDVKYCFSSLKSLYTLYKSTNDARYKVAALKASGEVVKERTLNQSIRDGIGGRLWALYDLTGEQQYKTKLEKLANDIISGKVDTKDTKELYTLYLFEPFYQDGGFEVREYQIWAAGDIYIPAYKATQNLIYLQAAQEFFDKAKIPSHIEDFKKREQAPDVNALEYLLDIAEVSSEPKKSEYLNQAYAFAQEIILSLWDNPSNIKFNGDNGFLFFFNRDENMKRPVHAGWRISQFVRMANKEFKLR